MKYRVYLVDASPIDTDEYETHDHGISLELGAEENFYPWHRIAKIRTNIDAHLEEADLEWQRQEALAGR